MKRNSGLGDHPRKRKLAPIPEDFDLALGWRSVMGNNQLAHDCSMAAARACVEVIEMLLRPEEWPIARDEFYRVVMGAFEAYDLEKRREAIKATPSVN